MANIGDIYSVKIFYDDNPSQHKTRPVLVVNVEEELGLYTIAEITRTGPKNPPTYFDQFKEPIFDWRRAGLNSSSFVKTHKIHRVPEDKLLKFCGELEGNELVRILNRIVEVNT